MAHDLPIENTTYRAFTEKLGASDPQEFVGNPGDLFWNPNEGEVNISDGKTVGGAGLKTRRLDITTRYVDQFQWLNVWDKLQNVNESDVYANAVTTDAAGNVYVIGGRSNDDYPVVSKFSPDGYNDWNRIYFNDDGDKTYMSGDGIALSPDGESVYALFSSKFSNESQIAVVQLDTYGNVTRSMEIDRSSYQEQGTEIVVDSDGYVYVIGTVNSEGNNRDIFVTKLTADLQQEWSKVYDKNGDWQRGEGIAVDASGLYITGRATYNTVFVARISKENGTFVWQREYNNSAENYDWSAGFGIAVSGTSVYVTGKAYNPIPDERTLFLLKLDKNGNVKWQRGMIYGGFSQGLALVADSSDNVYLSGYADSPTTVEGQQPDVAERYNQVLIAKFDANGNNVWQKAFGGKNNEFDIPGSDNSNVSNWGQGFGHHSINLNNDEDYLYVCGATYSPHTQWQRAFLLRITADGDNSGVYGDWILQNSNLVVNSEEQFLLVGNDTLVASATQNIDFIRTNSSSNLYDDGNDGNYYRLVNRAPFELNIPNGTITAAVGRFRDQISIGDWPIKVNGWNRSLYIGDTAGSNDTGAWNNIAIGQYSAENTTNGSSNVFLGRGTGRNNTTGYGNVFLGRDAGYDNYTGSNNVAIGYNSGYSLSQGDHNVVIGETNVDNGNSSYQLAIGSNGDWWIKGDYTRSVTIKHDLILNDAGTGIYMKSPNGSNWQILIDNAGQMSINAV